MVEEKNRVEIDAEDARAGSTPGIARYVLAASLILVIAIFAALLVF